MFDERRLSASTIFAEHAHVDLGSRSCWENPRAWPRWTQTARGPSTRRPDSGGATAQAPKWKLCVLTLTHGSARTAVEILAPAPHPRQPHPDRCNPRWTVGVLACSNSWAVRLSTPRLCVHATKRPCVRNCRLGSGLFSMSDYLRASADAGDFGEFGSCLFGTPRTIGAPRSLADLTRHREPFMIELASPAESGLGVRVDARQQFATLAPGVASQNLEPVVRREQRTESLLYDLFGRSHTPGTTCP